MKNKILLLLFVFNFGFSQIEDAWVYFNDKPSASTFLANPLSMLTQRALDRRTVQNISIDITDVPVEEAYINQIVASNGITVKAKSKWMNALHIRGTQTDIQALIGLSFVNRIVYANHSLNPGGKVSKIVKSFQGNKFEDIQVNYNYGGSANQVEMLNGHLLHQANFTGQGKIIAVLDSGFTGVNTASSFSNVYPNKILGGYNFPDRTDIISNNSSTFYARHHHGTMVLSDMGAVVDNQLIGTAPDANYYLFITEDVNEENPVEESYWVEAAELADYYGADIINSSLGYFLYDNPDYSYTYADLIGNKAFASKGANIAFQKGIVVVVSAGNSGGSANPYVGVPAEATYALAIGAVDSAENYVGFSSIGPSFDNRIKPDVCAKGFQATVSNTSGIITTNNGTSFAGPIIAGMVATFWSAVPNLKATEVVDFIKKSADQYNTPDHLKGYGVPDFQIALNNALNSQSFIKTQIKVFPNPTENQLNFLGLENFIGQKIKISNVLGAIIYEGIISTSSISINTESWQSGVYLYSINNTFGKIIKK